MGGAGGHYAAPTSDTTAPTGTLVNHPNVTGTASFYDFTIRWDDDTAIDIATLQTGNVFVSGPGGDIVPEFVSVDTHTNGTPRTATYRLTPPGGSWDNADNGTYHVWTDDPPLAVFDTSGNPVATGDIGTFTVTVPAEGDAEGYYAKHVKMKDIAGPLNLAIYSALDGDATTEDQAVLQFAMDATDRYVDGLARTYFLTALAPHMIADDDLDFGEISDLASEIAVAKVYRARGITGDAQSSIEGQMADMDKRAVERLREIFNNRRLAQVRLTATMPLISGRCVKETQEHYRQARPTGRGQTLHSRS
jgi:hypothetical protein